MVGVAGKYKGCNTCRTRRVKCDNTRPYCRKCIDSGRECAGYERERVFIIGTPRELGRCSSHPRRTVSARRQRKATTSSGSDRPNSEEPGAASSSSIDAVEAAAPSRGEVPRLLPVAPLQPAWNDLVTVSRDGSIYNLQIASLNTDMSMVSCDEKTESSDYEPTAVSLPPYVLATRSENPHGDFVVSCRCLAHVSAIDEIKDESYGAVTSTDSICLFLFGHERSLTLPALPMWLQDSARPGSVKQLGPGHFKEFPAHHYFVRVYRPNAILSALVNRKGTFLSRPEWTALPWELHPKPELDRLLDVVSLVPALLQRADQVLVQGSSLNNRVLANQLLADCLNVEGLLDGWLIPLNGPVEGGASSMTQLPYWVVPVGEPSGIPVADSMYDFRDLATAMGFIYYWTALLVLVPCIERLNQHIFERPLPEAFPQLFPNDFYGLTQPGGISMGMMSSSPSMAAGGKNVRELADNICRSLDFALARSVQPDLLAAPLHLAQEEYSKAGMGMNSCNLELIWCEAFKARLKAKGQDIVNVVQSRKWRELQRFGS